MTVRPLWQEPAVALDDWFLVRHWTGYRLFGVHARDRKERVSSPVVFIDTESQIIRTESGRLYSLRGESVVASNVARFLGMWMERYNISKEEIDLVDLNEAALDLSEPPTWRRM